MSSGFIKGKPIKQEKGEWTDLEKVESDIENLRLTIEFLRADLFNAGLGHRINYETEKKAWIEENRRLKAKIFAYESEYDAVYRNAFAMASDEIKWKKLRNKVCYRWNEVRRTLFKGFKDYLDSM